MAAYGRLKKPFDVTEAMYTHRNKATETLYVGNLAFNTTEEDLRKALARYMGDQIVVEKVTIPCINGKSKYGFIEFSWPQSAMKDAADLMTVHSGRLQVNSRPISPRVAG